MNFVKKISLVSNNIMNVMYEKNLKSLLSEIKYFREISQVRILKQVISYMRSSMMMKYFCKWICTVHRIEYLMLPQKKEEEMSDLSSRLVNKNVLYASTHYQLLQTKCKSHISHEND